MPAVLETCTETDRQASVASPSSRRLLFPFCDRAQAKAAGRRGWRTMMVAASVQKKILLERLARGTLPRVGRALQLSLLLTQALVARTTESAHIHAPAKTAGPSRRPIPIPSRNSNNTRPADNANATFTPQRPHSAHPARPYLVDRAPWIYSLDLLARLLFFLPSPLPTASLAHAMASYAPSSSSNSDISTPRSISPSSVASARSSHSSISSAKRMSISSSRRISAANPMSSVDIASIEEAMRMANLDTLRGYAQNHYGEVRQYATTEYIRETQALGYQVLNEPMWNRGESAGVFLSFVSLPRPSPLRPIFLGAGPIGTFLLKCRPGPPDSSRNNVTVSVLGQLRGNATAQLRRLLSSSSRSLHNTPLATRYCPQFLSNPLPSSFHHVCRCILSGPAPSPRAGC